MSKIDVHHHFYSTAITEAIENAGGDPSGWTLPPWTIEADKEINVAVGTDIAILSVTAPGACIESNPVNAAKLARQINEDGAAIRDAHPTKYGFFASLPSLLDTDLALGEIEYALETLHADGVVVFTRYGEDYHYLGHPDFQPIWKELNRRKAVVFVHPTHLADTRLISPHLPQPMFDYAHETGRTAIDLITSGALENAPNCKIILSHAGGTLPYLIYRVAGMIPHTPFTIGKTTKDLLTLAKRFYFDTALSGSKMTLDLLYSFAYPGHVLFGSDFPNAPREGIEYFSAMFDAYSDDHQRNTREAALALFPRFR
ncbi:hypothetical protein ASPZODRAFT_159365 [Penicilliopsis zonata CBS 506.65]|uniref:6-methylsalicylate decarboxylase n=1 Tax=Penicilliopsis zonata CBS 506.65 TaxID=1073090 RepID=A0A1L9SH25_9EURO|nr:hypothetical protein ASPZODRAFT_159365 [Penicilliopsis zonata CBS 506.65]OJJ46451.1 hypothetical protein ASPZODRAFT_159365 [Penicilliopsis zonata CBS 506.65]